MGDASPSSFDAANRMAVDRIMEAEALLIDIAPAIKVIPDFKEDLFTYAGPLIDWTRMVKPQRLALTNLIIYEGFADTPEQAERLVEFFPNGKVQLSAIVITQVIGREVVITRQ